ncbi:phosphoribosylanthranilate isomerase [Thiomicrospira cyclica]|uniref:N-(5'-phosphoribosyl)anthranilate isomerase n=1 Tax=Thiomicrospira cyclica (strain DSM 14477 / JCM 11371 / ALM1) TaxID=717773 RepID=F6DC08_THICA|nr:phosphoribosylanthranilate isomerase [Thiomicrospira cyclica]AEG31394.1 Phosphoribosylanthranilate isomerase [Thiomicrospira cyclica ALM1]
MVTTRTRVKFCGITRIVDAQLAADLGVDAIGLVFYPPSPRSVTIKQAREIASVLPAFVTSTALFVNPTPDEVDTVLATVPIDLLQFHGDESGEFCRQFNRPYIKAMAMKPDLNWTALNREYSDARAFLVDTYKPGTPGGTGETFNWNWLPSKQQVDKPIILAGGLDANNVGKAIAQTGVFGVDVSGGIEASKGVKSAEKMQQFISNLIV